MGDEIRPPLIRRLSSRVKFGFVDTKQIDKQIDKVKLKAQARRKVKEEWKDVPTYPVADLDWLLAYRTVLMMCFQALVGTIAGTAYSDYDDGNRAKWWPLNVLVANAWTLAALSYALQGEGSGKNVAGLWTIPAGHKWLKIATKPKNIVWLVLMAASMYLTTANRWWPDTLRQITGWDIPNATFAKLPSSVIAICTVLMPLSTALADFPTYYGFVLPRLMKHYPKPEDWWKPITIVASWHALQYVTAPWMWSLQYIVWRFMSFFPMTMICCLALSKEPRLMPYAMIIQAVTVFPLLIEMYRRS
jgi:hypothetical protein